LGFFGTPVSKAHSRTAIGEFAFILAIEALAYSGCPVQYGANHIITLL
jgi:hypothetical protein